MTRDERGRPGTGAHHVRLAPTPVCFLLADQKVTCSLDIVRNGVCFASNAERLEGKHRSVGEADTPDITLSMLHRR